MQINEEKLPIRKTICDFCINFKETESWSFEYACALKDCKCESNVKCAKFEPTIYAKLSGILVEENKG